MEIDYESEETVYTLRRESEFINFDKPFYTDSTGKKFTVGVEIEKYSRNFSLKSDSLFVYLDTVDVESEIEKIKQELRN